MSHLINSSSFITAVFTVNHVSQVSLVVKFSSLIVFREVHCSLVLLSQGCVLLTVMCLSVLTIWVQKVISTISYVSKKWGAKILIWVEHCWEGRSVGLSLLISLLLSSSVLCLPGKVRFEERFLILKLPFLPLHAIAQPTGIQGLGHCQGRVTAPRFSLQSSLVIFGFLAFCQTFSLWATEEGVLVVAV